MTWNTSLIHNDIYYISQFRSDNNDRFLSYPEFINHWKLNKDYFSHDEYILIIRDINYYSSRSVGKHDMDTNRDIACINDSYNLNFFNPPTKLKPTIVKGKFIRSQMMAYRDPAELAPLIKWKGSLGGINIEWSSVFDNMYNISNNFKLIQFQYKLIMRISTCRYKRKLMKIAEDDICVLCNNYTETLDHLFIHCTATRVFINTLNDFIVKNIDNTYTDINHYYFITSHHTSDLINYLNLLAKWYISRRAQKELQLEWVYFIIMARYLLIGEKNNINNKLEQHLT